MLVSRLGSTPFSWVSRQTKSVPVAILATGVLALGLMLGWNRPLPAAGLFGVKEDPARATTSRSARQSAIRSIPFDRLDADARAKVNSVLSNVTVFRRMPTRVIDCDPKLYLFIVQHPDVVVNVWEVLGISKLRMRQVDAERYQVSEPTGTSGTAEFLYRSHDTQVVYAKGTYKGPLLPQPVNGRVLMILKTGYVLETDGRHYITTRLDTFLNVERGAVELLTKTFHPLVGSTADSNFVQSISFVGALSRTAEVNTRGVQRLSVKLQKVQPHYREKLASLAAEIGKRAANSDRAPPKSSGQIMTTRVPPPSFSKNRSTQRPGSSAGSTTPHRLRR